MEVLRFDFSLVAVVDEEDFLFFMFWVWTVAFVVEDVPALGEDLVAVVPPDFFCLCVSPFFEVLALVVRAGVHLRIIKNGGIAKQISTGQGLFDKLINN